MKRRGFILFSFICVALISHYSFASPHCDCDPGNAQSCQAFCEERATQLREPKDEVVEFGVTECLRMGGVCAMCDKDCVPRTYGPGCWCHYGIEPHGGPGVFPGWNDDPCLLYGRAFNCIYQEDEFPGCNPDESETSCVSICENIRQRIIIDNVTTHDAQVHEYFCDEDLCMCCCVLEIGGRCYHATGFNWEKPSYDCSVPAREIWEEWQKSREFEDPCAGDGCGCSETGSHGLEVFPLLLLLIILRTKN